MKNVSLKVRPVFMACAAAGMATQGMVLAQDSIPVTEEPINSGWSIRVGAASRFNIKSSVQSVVPATGAGIYDDGFVKPDASGSTAKTWNWGYNSSSQVSGDQIQFHRLDSVPTIQNGSVNEPAYGGEAAARYSIYEFEIGKTTARVGFEFGYGFSTFSGNLNSSASGMASLTTDGYKLGGITPPVPPYVGSAAGPGPIIDVTPSSSTTTGPFAETASFQGKLSADLHDIRLGPTFEIDITKRLSASFGLGYSALYADANLNYSETKTYAGGLGFLSGTSNATIGKREWLSGFYTSLMVDYRITKHIGAFAEGDYHYNKELNFGDASHAIKMDFGSNLGAKVGVIFWF